VIFPVTGLSCHRHLADKSARLSASVGAPEPHDFAVRDERHSSHDASRPSHPASRIVTTAKRPSCRSGTAMMKHLIWGNDEAKYFFDEDWTGKISLKRLEKLAF
jgi:hypothetical protein